MIILHRKFFGKEIQCSSTGVITWSFHVILHSKIHSTVEEWKVTVACSKLNAIIKIMIRDITFNWSFYTQVLSWQTAKMKVHMNEITKCSS